MINPDYGDKNLKYPYWATREIHMSSMEGKGYPVWARVLSPTIFYFNTSDLKGKMVEGVIIEPDLDKFMDVEKKKVYRVFHVCGKCFRRKCLTEEQAFALGIQLVRIQFPPDHKKPDGFDDAHPNFTLTKRYMMALNKWLDEDAETILTLEDAGTFSASKYWSAFELARKIAERGAP